RLAADPGRNRMAVPAHGARGRAPPDVDRARSRRADGAARRALRAVAGARRMNAVELFAGHVARFNEGVQGGNFERMHERFADDAVREFVGVPVGPSHGIDAIRAAYREQPPDDEITIDEPWQDGDTVVAPYGWRRDGGRRAGEMRLTIRDAHIARLVVTF